MATVLALMALVLAACGDDDEGDASSGNADVAAKSCPEVVSAGNVRITSITVEGGDCAEVISVLQDWADTSAPSPGPEGWECVAQSEDTRQSYKCGRQPVVMRFKLEASG